jgi:hypothetical protein
VLSLRFAGHQIVSLMVRRLAGTRMVRTRRVSSRMPMATAVPTSVMLDGRGYVIGEHLEQTATGCSW